MENLGLFNVPSKAAFLLPSNEGDSDICNYKRVRNTKVDPSDVAKEEFIFVLSSCLVLLCVD